jgi:flagellar basal-body rod protein FlgB
MIIDKLDAALRFDQEALGLRARRQEVIASNIANADTPGYKARDFDFAGALSRAAAEGRQPRGAELASTSSRHVHGSVVATSDPEMLFRSPSQSSLDGNTVEMDAERASFADNALRYEAGLTVISSKLKSIQAALQQ